MKKGTKEKVTLGSGKLYMAEYTGNFAKDFADILAQLMTEENHAGWIKGGASIVYKPTMTTEKDDLNHIVKEILTDEEATLKSGLFTWNGKTLAKLTATAQITTETRGGKTYRRLKIGGPANDDGKQYAILFVHEDPVEGNCYLLVVGRNTAGFTITFVADSATVIDAEFTCKPHDDRGTLIEFVEEIDEEYQQTYTEEELNALAESQIETIAKAKGYTLTGSGKSEKIASFLAAQEAAGGNVGGNGGTENDGETPGGNGGTESGGETPGGNDVTENEGESGEYQQTYTEEELNAMTVAKIEKIAQAKGYTLTGGTKAEKIASFLAAQGAAGGEPEGNEDNNTEEGGGNAGGENGEE